MRSGLRLDGGGDDRRKAADRETDLCPDRRAPQPHAGAEHLAVERGPDRSSAVFTLLSFIPNSTSSMYDPLEGLRSDAAGILGLVHGEPVCRRRDRLFMPACRAGLIATSIAAPCWYPASCLSRKSDIWRDLQARLRHRSDNREFRLQRNGEQRVEMTAVADH
jgi:hypothetical protein